VFGEYADGRNWLNNVLVKDNFFSGNMPADGKYIWMQNGGNTIISDNIINHQTAGTNPVAIQISGQTSNTGYSYPTIVKHNVIRGTTNRYDGNSTLAAIFIDAVPILLSKLPLATAGSVMWAADGTPGTDPCTGGGTGTQAFPNGDFTWRCKP